MTVSRRSLFVLIVLVLGISAAMQAWHGWRQQQLGTELAERARPGDIRLLVSDTCSACHHARQWLQAHRVPFSECSIERDAACLQTFREAFAPGTPLVMVRGESQLGFDPERVLAALQEIGATGRSVRG